ncbi:unnamed protein product, partial [Rhizoctonia solani]
MRCIQAIQGRENIQPYEHFNVIAGTGTGGISACMLGKLRMPVDKVIEKYAKLVEDVFKDKKISGIPMYKATKLQEVLETMISEATGADGEMMTEDQRSSPCKTMVFAMARHNLNVGLPVIFRSYPVTTNSGPNCTIYKALRATLAHPDLFEGTEITDHSVSQSFVGGDIGCSSPLAHVLTEVERVWPTRKVTSIISLGAGHARTIQMLKPSWWQRTQDVIVMKDMATDSERVAEEMAVRFQGTSGVYFRFSVDQGVQDMEHGSWERLGETMQHAKGYLQKNETNQMLDEATGRTDENTQVIACITGGDIKRPVCVVYGLGGAGKTQLVLNVIEQTWDQWAHVIYVDASSEEAIENALKKFGTFKQIGDTSKDVVNWLESCSKRWLVVFNNADTPSTDFQ